MKQLAKSLLSRLFPDLLKFFREIKLSQKCNKVQHTNSGLLFCGSQDFNSYEPSTSQTLLSLAKPSTTFINIGANHGVFCLKLLPVVSKIYAFEALHQNQKYLLKNVWLNSAQNKFHVFPVAVSQSEGLSCFYGASTGGSFLQGWNDQRDSGTLVPIYSIDYLLKSHCYQSDLLFLIDVEGHEFNVIDNAKDISLVVEVPCKEFMPGQVFNPNFKDLFDLFFDRNFFAYEIHSDGSLEELNRGKILSMISLNRYHGLMALFSKTPVNASS